MTLNAGRERLCGIRYGGRAVGHGTRAPRSVFVWVFGSAMPVFWPSVSGDALCPSPARSAGIGCEGDSPSTETKAKLMEVTQLLDSISSDRLLHQVRPLNQPSDCSGQPTVPGQTAPGQTTIPGQTAPVRPLDQVRLHQVRPLHQVRLLQSEFYTRSDCSDQTAKYTRSVCSGQTT